MITTSDIQSRDEYAVVGMQNALDAVRAALSLPPRESEKEPEDETGTISA